MIRFSYRVKFNGVYYPPNTPIPEPAKKAENAAESAPELKGEEEAASKTEPAKKAVKGRKKGDA